MKGLKGKRGRIFWGFCSAAAVMLAMGGCQPTPEQEVITQKENINDVVEKYAGETTQVDTDGENSTRSLSLKEQLGVPDTISFDITIGSGKGKITGKDVVIEMPDVTQAGAASVIRADFSDEELMAMIDKFTGGRTLYEPRPITKEDLMESIERTQALINELKANGSEEDQKQIPSLEEEIKFRQQSMDEVLAEADVKAIPAQFPAGEDEVSFLVENTDEELRYEVGISKEASAHIVSLSKSRHSVYEYLVTQEFVRDLFTGEERSKMLDSFETNTCKYTKDDAVDLCMEFLRDYGISTENLFVRSVEPVAYYDPRMQTVGESLGYEINLNHGVGGLSQTMTDNHIMYMSEDGAVYGENEGRLTYDYEDIILHVTDDGVVSLQWVNPMEVGEIISDQVTLKSFDEIRPIMEQHLEMAYESYNSDCYENGLSFKVTRISFGLMRVQNKDDEMNYTLIPVWDVFGMIELDDTHSEDEALFMKNSVMTINAMDGSIINRNTGY